MQTYQSLLITGSSGDIGKALITDLSKFFKRIYCIDKDLIAIDLPENTVFERCDLNNGFSKSAIDFIITNANQGICMLNLIGLIGSNTFVNLTWSATSHLENLNRNSKIIGNHFEIDFKLPVLLSIELANAVISMRGYASIVNLSSISALGNIGQTAYSSMKSAIETSTVVLAKEFASFDVRFNCLAPGFLDTPSMFKAVPVQEIERLKREIPMRKLGSVSSLIPAIKALFFSEYLNGQTLRVDGGYRL